MSKTGYTVTKRTAGTNAKCQVTVRLEHNEVYVVGEGATWEEAEGNALVEAGMNATKEHNDGEA